MGCLFHNKRDKDEEKIRISRMERVSMSITNAIIENERREHQEWLENLDKYTTRELLKDLSGIISNYISGYSLRRDVVDRIIEVLASRGIMLDNPCDDIPA